MALVFCVVFYAIKIILYMYELQWINRISVNRESNLLRLAQVLMMSGTSEVNIIVKLVL